VFNIEYTSPSVEDLKTSAIKLLTKLYS
jgi:hypothetical protein